MILAVVAAAVAVQRRRRLVKHCVYAALSAYERGDWPEAHRWRVAADAYAEDFHQLPINWRAMGFTRGS